MKKLFNGLETDYLDGFQYKFTNSWEDPSGTMMSDEMKLRIIPTSEGYFDALRNRYFYNYTDHLGNVRLSYNDANGNNEVTGDIVVNNCVDTPDGQMCNNYIITGEAEGVTNYYPFGMIHNGEYNNFENAYQNKYNGKELQETGMYDYGSRFYMPDLGRWGVVDPLAETSRRFTPYHYGNNNPVRFTDPDGRQSWDNLNSYSQGSAVAGFMKRNGFDDENLPMFYSDEGGMMIANTALGNNGEGGGGTIGSLMDAVGITMNGSIGSYESSIGIVSLWQQLKDAGWNDPANSKAKYEDAAKISEMSIIKDLVSILNNVSKQPAGSNIFFEKTNNWMINGQSKGYKILLNIDNISNVLELAYVIGHETNHSITDYFRHTFYETVKSNGPMGRNAFNYFSELISYSWEEKWGKTRRNLNASDYTYYIHGPNSPVQILRHSQSEVDLVNNNLRTLLKLYNNFTTPKQ